MNQEINKAPVDFIRISPKGLTAEISVVTFQENDFIVTLCPSLYISGYGRTEDESREMFEEALKDYLITLKSLQKNQIEAELKKYGFTVRKINQKNFSKSFVDQNGLLQGFDLNIEQVKFSELSTAV